MTRPPDPLSVTPATRAGESGTCRLRPRRSLRRAFGGHALTGVLEDHGQGEVPLGAAAPAYGREAALALWTPRAAAA